MSFLIYMPVSLNTLVCVCFISNVRHILSCSFFVGSLILWIKHIEPCQWALCLSNTFKWWTSRIHWFSDLLTPLLNVIFVNLIFRSSRWAVEIVKRSFQTISVNGMNQMVVLSSGKGDIFPTNSTQYTLFMTKNIVGTNYNFSCFFLVKNWNLVVSYFEMGDK